MEPTILRIQQKVRQKEQESKIYETLKLELENYKK